MQYSGGQPRKSFQYYHHNTTGFPQALNNLHILMASSTLLMVSSTLLMVFLHITEWYPSTLLNILQALDMVFPHGADGFLYITDGILHITDGIPPKY